MAPLSSLTLKTRRVGKRSKARSNCSTKEWYRALLLHREDYSVRGGCSGDRGLERVIAIGQGSGHLNRDLIESREGGRERRAEYRGIRGPDLDAHLAGIVDRVRWHLNAGGDWRGGGRVTDTPTTVPPPGSGLLGAFFPGTVPSFATRTPSELRVATA